MTLFLFRKEYSYPAKPGHRILYSTKKSSVALLQEAVQDRAKKGKLAENYGSQGFGDTGFETGGVVHHLLRRGTAPQPGDARFHSREIKRNHGKGGAEFKFSLAMVANGTLLARKTAERLRRRSDWIRSRPGWTDPALAGIQGIPSVATTSGQIASRQSEF